jgi:two-component system LytT family response regulator
MTMDGVCEQVRLRAVIVDDERPARDDLRRLAAAFPQIEIVGEADSAASAERLVRACRPDVLFLDVDMPGASGFELLRRLDDPLGRLEDPPHVVFVTAHPQYAIQAFEARALDYLLKPVHPGRLARTLSRLLEPRPLPPPGCSAGPLPPPQPSAGPMLPPLPSAGLLPAGAPAPVAAEPPAMPRS